MASVKPLQLKCIAQTSESFCSTPTGSQRTQSGQHPTQKRSPSNCFQHAQFSGDGTSILTKSADHCLRTFVLPVDLLDDKAQPHLLNVHSTFQAATPIRTYACYPYFNLQDPSTTVVLSASADLPVTLYNALHYGTVHAKYPLINPTTEEYIAPSSLLWTRDGTHFVAGSHNNISVFDASRDGSSPVLSHKTAVGKREKKLFGGERMLGCQGTVTALSTNCNGMLAAGTRERHVGLYAHEGSGECTTHFTVDALPCERDGVKGTGIMQLTWSPCGTYLLVAERQSDGIQVYDIRNTMSRVAWLKARKADTTQKLGIDLVPAPDGYEVWAGGMDGRVRMWRNPGSVEGEHGPDVVLDAHDDPVSSIVWHPSGTVLATCSGRREASLSAVPTSNDWDSSSSENETQRYDNSLKVWVV